MNLAIPPLLEGGGVADALEARGLGEYTALLIENGLTLLSDLRGITDAELQSIGVTKLFHRKRILQIAADEEQKGSSTAATPRVPLERSGRTPRSQGSTPRPLPVPLPASAAAAASVAVHGGTGDHIRVEVLGARSGDTVLTERQYFLKASLCDLIDQEVYPIEHGVQRTPKARGPMPVWPAGDKNVLKVATTFRPHSLALELKEYRMFGENRLVGVLLFPLTKFHAFANGDIEEAWFPLRADVAEDSAVTASVLLRLSVPGGCPRCNSAGYHVRSVVMKHRKLRVTVFDAALTNGGAGAAIGGASSASTTLSPAPTPRTNGKHPGKQHPSTPRGPNLYVTLHLEECVQSPALAAGGGGGDGAGGAALCSSAAAAAAVDPTPTVSGAEIKAKTKLVRHATNPTFDEAFEFFAEVGRCKLLTVKLKEETGSVITTHGLVGQVRIPIQFFLAQRHPDEVDEAFPALDEHGVEQARVHVRLQVLPMADGESGPTDGVLYRRRNSLPKSRPDPVDVESHPAFSPLREGQQQEADGGGSGGGGLVHQDPSSSSLPSVDRKYRSTHTHKFESYSQSPPSMPRLDHTYSEI